jgi:hypothetical protein
MAFDLPCGGIQWVYAPTRGDERQEDLVAVLGAIARCACNGESSCVQKSLQRVHVPVDSFDVRE